MVNNQIEFNSKYPKGKKEVKKVEEKRNRNFQGQLVIEDYSELEELYLKSTKNIEKITLKGLPQLWKCTIWDCGMQGLAIENCPQIKIHY